MVSFLSTSATSTFSGMTTFSSSVVVVVVVVSVGACVVSVSVDGNSVVVGASGTSDTGAAFTIGPAVVTSVVLSVVDAVCVVASVTASVVTASCVVTGAVTSVVPVSCVTSSVVNTLVVSPCVVEAVDGDTSFSIAPTNVNPSIDNRPSGISSPTWRVYVFVSESKLAVTASTFAANKLPPTAVTSRTDEITCFFFLSFSRTCTAMINVPVPIRSGSAKEDAPV